MRKPKVVLVTGASAGIGQCCARHLSRQGYRVYGTSRSAADTGRFTAIQMDVTDDSSVEAGVEYLAAREAAIDVLVNNAGFALIGSLEDTSIEEVKSQLETNFFGALRVCRAVLPYMRQQRGGLIISISSIGGLIGLPFQSAYCASKFALEGAMEALRMEVRPFGIRVVLVEPGDFRTELTGRRQMGRRAVRGSVYSSRLANVLRIVASGEQSGPTPEPIAALVHKVINTKTPRLRYTAGPCSQRLAVPLKKILPARLFESIIVRHFKAY